MRGALRKIGNSSAIIIPELVLTAIGLTVGDSVELTVQNGRLLVEAVRRARAGWAEDARRIAEAGDDGLVLGEFGDAGDEY